MQHCICGVLVALSVRVLSESVIPSALFGVFTSKSASSAYVPQKTAKGFFFFPRRQMAFHGILYRKCMLVAGRTPTPFVSQVCYEHNASFFCLVLAFREVSNQLNQDIPDW